MTIKLDRSKVCKLLLICTETVTHYLNAAALERDEEIRKSIAGTARMWVNIRDDIRQQLDAWDEKQMEKKK